MNLPLGLESLGTAELGVFAAVALLVVYLAWRAVISWIRRVLLRLTFRHVAFTAAGAFGAETLRGYVPGGLSGVLDAVVGVVV